MPHANRFFNRTASKDLPKLREEIRRLYEEENKTLQEIGVLLSKDHTTILEHLHRIGAKMKPQNSKKTYKLIRGFVPKESIPRVKRETAKRPLDQKTIRELAAARLPKFDSGGRRINQTYAELHFLRYGKKVHKNMYNMVI